MRPSSRAGSRQAPRVVILGGGFAGLEAAKAMRGADVEVTLLDRNNHHVFQPLLYQVATAMLAPTDITVPVRWVLRRAKNVTVLLADAQAVDTARRVVVVGDGGGEGEGEERREIPYEYLIIATGARHSYFGHPEWEAIAPGLKSIDDAQEIRNRFLSAFERAEATEDGAERAAWQTFVVIGGGPTGVELAGMIPDVAQRALRRDFRRIDTARTRTILLEGGPRVLPTFPEALSERARRDLEALGVDVRTGSLVTRVTESAVYVGDERIPTRTVFWAAGNAASPLARSLGVPLDRAGRVKVEPDLSLPGHPEVFVAGDLAVIQWKEGRLVPGVAPAANQEGRQAARNVLRRIRGEPTRPFRYRNKGDLATIGRHRAIADFGRFRMAGRIAWLLWLFVHIMYLVGFRNRAMVLVQWGYAYFTYQRGARLITWGKRRGVPAAVREAAVPPAW